MLFPQLSLRAFGGGRRLALGLAALAALAVTVFAGFGAAAPEGRDFRAQMAATAEEAFPKDMLKRVRDSLYLVSVELPTGARAPVGTAFVVRLGDGSLALATSAQVADVFRRELTHDAAFSGGRMTATRPTAPHYESRRIVSVIVHPGWDAFEAFSARLAGRMRAEGLTFTAPRAYGVALLIPETPPAGAPLELAPTAEIDALRPRAPLALAGFVSPDVIYADLTRPEPGLRLGALTAHVDALQNLAAAGGRAIQHSIASAGASSGAPLLDAAGRVVGVQAAAEPMRFSPERGGFVATPDAARLLGGAARADLLGALAAGEADERLAAEQETWLDAETAFVQPAEDVLADSVYLLKREAGPGDETRLVFEASAMSAPDSQTGQPTAWFEVETPEAGLYMALAFSPDRRAVLALVADVDGGFIGVGTGGAFHSAALFDPGERGRVRLGAAFDPANEEGGRLTVRLYRAIPRGS